MLVFGISLCAVRSQAQPADDEARIEELLRAERQGSGTSTPAQPPDASAKKPAASNVSAERSLASAAESVVPAKAAPIADPVVPSTEEDPDAIEFKDLKNYVGRRVRISTVAGAEYVVTVLAAGSAETRVKGREVSGSFEFTLNRRQVARIAKL